MMAYEVVGLCEDNNRTYESVLGTYSKETGFVLSEVTLGLDKNVLANRLFQLNDWHLKKEKKKEPVIKEMTLEEIEKELGYKFKIKEEKNLTPKQNKIKNNKNTKKKTQEDNDNDMDDFYAWFLNQLFCE